MELASISKIDGNLYNLKWRTWNEEKYEFLEQEQECDIRTRENASKTRRCKKSKLNCSFEKETPLDCKAWVDEPAVMKVVFIGEQCFITDQAVVVYGEIAKSTKKFETVAGDEKVSEGFLSESKPEDVGNGIPLDPPTTNPPEEFRCPTCSFVSISKRGLFLHESNKHQKKQYKCELCDKLFLRRYDLDQHNREKHWIASSHSCTQCGKGFPTAVHLADHQKYAHESEKKFVCEICGKGFVRDRYLQRHSVVHQEERPFPCQHEGCEKRCKSQRALDLHHLVHLDPSKQRFRCPEENCKRTFYSKCNYDFHLTRHKTNLPFRCDSPECNLFFETKTSLQRHKIRKASDLRRGV